MRRLMGIGKNRHGTYYAIKKVPKALQDALARVLDKGKQRQVWLKRSLSTKDLHEANIRAKPVLMDFDRIIARAEDQLKPRPLRPSLTDIEIKRIADFFYAHARNTRELGEALKAAGVTSSRPTVEGRKLRMYTLPVTNPFRQGNEPL